MMKEMKEGIVLWLTGRPASGKSTLARSLHARLQEAGKAAVLLDSDELRKLLTPQPTFREAERDWFYEVMGGLAVLLARSGANVIVAATAAKRAYRQAVRQQLTQFAEIHVACDLEACQARDPKGIYALAAAGLAETVPGVGVPYEAPADPEVTVDTAVLSPENALAELLHSLTRLGLLPPDVLAAFPAGEPLQPLTVAACMTADPVVITPQTTLLAARQMMRRHDFRHLPVLQDEKLCSLITISDLRRAELAVAAQYKGSQLTALVQQSQTVSEIMAPVSAWIAPQATVAEAAQLLLAHKLSALPVIENEKLVGIVTDSDLLQRLAAR